MYFMEQKGILIVFLEQWGLIVNNKIVSEVGLVFMFPCSQTNIKYEIHFLVLSATWAREGNKGKSNYDCFPISN